MRKMRTLRDILLFWGRGATTPIAPPYGTPLVVLRIANLFKNMLCNVLGKWFEQCGDAATKWGTELYSYKCSFCIYTLASTCVHLFVFNDIVHSKIYYFSDWSSFWVIFRCANKGDFLFQNSLAHILLVILVHGPIELIVRSYRYLISKIYCRLSHLRKKSMHYNRLAKDLGNHSHL